MIRLHKSQFSKMTFERLLPHLAESIKNRRTRLSLSHAELADLTGLSAEYLDFIESGGTNFSMKTLSTIAEALNTVPSELIEEAEHLADAQARDGLR